MIAARPTPMYNLVWVVNGKIKETILENKAYTMCKWKASQLKSAGTHEYGLLQPRKVEQPTTVQVTLNT